MKPGTQVIYVPLHADGNISHPDAERGFVTSMRGTIAFCRFFLNHPHYRSRLRSTANSEATPIANLVIQNHTDQEIIDQLLIDIANY